MKLRALHIVAAVACAFAAQSASASLIYNSALLAPAQGFGTAPRDLTLQATGQSVSPEGGSVGVSSTGAITFGTSIPDGSVFMGNGFTNENGTADMPNPLADDLKYGIPTTGSLGITSASQIGVLFNATEPQGDSVNVIDVTLKFYTSAGTFLGAIDGSQNFLSSNPGNGVAGFTFVIDALQQPTVNGWLATGGSGTTLALEASILDFAGGPESFLIYNIAPTTVPAIPEPGTYAMMLAGLGVMGFIARRRRNKD